jgi:putative transposase
VFFTDGRSSSANDSPTPVGCLGFGSRLRVEPSQIAGQFAANDSPTPLTAPDPVARQLHLSREDPPMPRRPRFSTAGYVFHVLNRAAGRRTIFETPEDYDAWVALLDQARNRVAMRVVTFCVMPNHWHLVLWPETDDALPEFMHWLTVTHTQRWHAFHALTGTGPLYQGRYKSFPVEEDDHFFTLCRYVERNALRAHLVSRAELWKWSGLWSWRNESPTISLAAWPVSRPTDWIELVNQPQTESELGAIRNSVARSRPFGSSEWTRATAKALGLERSLGVAGRQPG